jgi:hypothetical protein
MIRTALDVVGRTVGRTPVAAIPLVESMAEGGHQIRLPVVWS